MKNTEQKNTKKNILKQIGKAMMIVGAIIFVVGIFMQMFSVFSTMGNNNFVEPENSIVGSYNFAEPENFFIVIISGFAVLFFGVILTIASNAVEVQKTHGSITDAIQEHVMMSLKERMCESEEIVCGYCGTVLNKGERGCPNCGANRTKK